MEAGDATHKCLEPVYIKDFRIGKGWLLVLNLYAMMQTPVFNVIDFMTHKDSLFCKFFRYGFSPSDLPGHFLFFCLICCSV